MGNKDRWSSLSMIDRADLIKLYVSNGITSLDNIKKDYNSFGDGGGTQVELPDNIVKRLAYLIGSDYSVSSKGYASWDDIKRILSGKGGYPEFDDDKATFIFGNILGLPPAEGSNGKDYSKYLKDKYPLKYLLGKINEYQGIINPYNSYVIDERDRGLVEELAKKGKGVYLNADSEYSYMADIYDPPPYRNDVAGYHAQFVNTPDGYAISASDLYDFGPDYAGEKYNTQMSTKDKILTGVESAALGFVGNPYILRQDNIPIEFINANDATWVEDKKDRIKGFSYALEHGMLSSEDRAKGVTLDEKLAKVLETGYIEPAVVTAEAKKANGGRLLDGTGEEQTLSGLPIPGITEWFDTYMVNNTKFSAVPEAPIDENELVKRQAWAESAGNDKAGSHKGAKGRYQIMPSTLIEYQKATGDIGDIYNPVYNRRVRDWEFNRYKNSDQVNRGEPTDSVKMGRRLAIYNYGYGNVRRALNIADSLGTDINNSFEWLKHLPQETQDYVNFILRNKDTGAHRTNNAYKNRKK